MIEVEIKVPISENNVALLIDGADFIGEKTQRDKYYDNKEYDLTTKSIWLRDRNGSFELKYPIETFEPGLSNRYKEYESDEEIKEVLSLSNTLSIEDAISEAGYFPFSDYVTVRKSYKNNEFRIDVDETNFGYSLCEVECMVENEGDILKAEENIKKFISDRGIDPTRLAVGKLVMYLKKNKPEHFKKLVDCKVLTVY